jgi:hypothetical protein
MAANYTLFGGLTIMERFTISFANSFAEDRNNAFATKLIKNYVISAPALYRVIAAHLNVDVSDIPSGDTDKAKKVEVAALRDRIRENDAKAACVGVAEKLVNDNVTVVDKMATNIDQRPVFVRPVRKGDRVKVQPPIKRPIVGGLEVATMRPKRCITVTHKGGKFQRPVKNGVTV